MTNCKILHLLSGAKEARGLTVIIDVFRAFSLECYLYDLGAGLVRPVGSVEEARELQKKIPGSVLIGERQGIKVEGFDFGNSPAQVESEKEKIEGKVIIHTTSAGTQGIVNAVGATEILTGSLVNARAVAEYIRKETSGKALEVSLVAMGLSAKKEAAEDELCAEYIKLLVEENKILPAFEERRQDLKNHDGKRFFDPALQEHFPEKDYYMCIKQDLFPFVLRIGKDDLGFFSERIDV
ncbi:MAG: 2-phosphosulfolactate phosphatase [Clostridiales bacterium]|nr:2-phosphosulfolactate phosphatase [Clostridiales bacterium]